MIELVINIIDQLEFETALNEDIQEEIEVTEETTRQYDPDFNGGFI